MNQWLKKSWFLLTGLILLILIGDQFHLVGRALASEGAPKDHVEASPQSAPKREAVVSQDKSFGDISLQDAATEADLSIRSLLQKVEHGIVVFIMGTGCPKVNRNLDEVKKLAKEYQDKGILVIGVNPHDSDDPSTINHHAHDANLNFHVLHDPGGKLTQSLGTKRLNEFILIDKDLDKLYRGDISEGNGKNPYLKNAIDALIAGKFKDNKNLKMPYKPTSGCDLAYTPPERTPGLNYCEHIAPIIQKKCQACHVENGAGPFKLTTYQDLTNWKEMIHTVVMDRRMPPWGADHHYYPEGGFLKDRSLSPKERNLILQWVSLNNPPEGDKSKCPQPEPPKPEWDLGKPDLILSTDNKFEVPQSGQLSYQYFDVELPEFKGPTMKVQLPEKYKDGLWVSATQVRPGNKKVVHHILVHSIEENPNQADLNLVLPRLDEPSIMFKNIPEKRRPKYRDFLKQMLKLGPLYDPARSNVVGSFGPGTGTHSSDTTAVYLPPKATLTFEVHYTPTGISKEIDYTEATKDTPGHTTDIGLYFTDHPVRRIFTNPAAVNLLKIPAGDPNYEVNFDMDFPKDSHITVLGPHMHKLGKNMRYVLERPDGSKQTILSISRWDFKEQTNYPFANAIAAPKGSKLHITAHFDNSIMNPNNPYNPPEDVAWGFQTVDEMMNGWVGFYLDEELGKK